MSRGQQAAACAVDEAMLVVGVGDTPYGEDYRLVRAGQARTNAYGYALEALGRALRDAKLPKSAIDGLIVGPPLSYERAGETLGLDVKWGLSADSGAALPMAAAAVQAGYAQCIALVYGNDQRATGVNYGGPNAMGGDAFLSYVYFSPWGMTSQGALYALLATRYMNEFGLSAAGLSNVALNQRAFAQKNEKAVMRQPLSEDDYFLAPYVVEPLRLFDYTLVNDGGVAMIVCSRDFARSMRMDQSVEVTGIAQYHLNENATSLRPRLEDYYHRAHREVANQIYNAVGYGPEDVHALQVYDSFSIHVPIALSGFGFCKDEDVDARLIDGTFGPEGRTPVNTSGGHLSESYMQGWNHQVEAIRQIRGHCGDRQVDPAQRIQYVSDVAGKVVSIMFERAN